MPDFKGYISDLGGPSANMYSMHGYDTSICERCARPSCLHPHPCPNLNNNHAPLLDIYRQVSAMPDIKKCFIGSGVRYDLIMADNKDPKVNAANKEYQRQLITHHVSGRLKVAPEHTSDNVLNVMRKPSFDLFRQFKRNFDNINAKEGLKQQIIPYFISSHPGCKEIDMAGLAIETKNLNFHLEQVQDFTPTPMTVSTEIYYTGVHPYTLEPIYTPKSEQDKQSQRKYFFWYDPNVRPEIIRSLNRLHRPDLLRQLFGHTPYKENRNNHTTHNGNNRRNRHRNN